MERFRIARSSGRVRVDEDGVVQMPEKSPDGLSLPVVSHVVATLRDGRRLTVSEETRSLSDVLRMAPRPLLLRLKAGEVALQSLSELVETKRAVQLGGEARGVCGNGSGVPAGDAHAHAALGGGRRNAPCGRVAPAARRP